MNTLKEIKIYSDNKDLTEESFKFSYNEGLNSWVYVSNYEALAYSDIVFIKERIIELNILFPGGELKGNIERKTGRGENK